MSRLGSKCARWVLVAPSLYMQNDTITRLKQTTCCYESDTSRLVFSSITGWFIQLYASAMMEISAAAVFTIGGSRRAAPARIIISAEQLFGHCSPPLRVHTFGDVSCGRAGLSGIHHRSQAEAHRPARTVPRKSPLPQRSPIASPFSPALPTASSKGDGLGCTGTRQQVDTASFARWSNHQRERCWCPS